MCEKQICKLNSADVRNESSSMVYIAKSQKIFSPNRRIYLELDALIRYNTVIL